METDPSKSVMGFLSTLLFIITVASLPNMSWNSYMIAGAIVLSAAAFLRVNLLIFIKRILIFELFALGIALMSLFRENGLLIFSSMVTKSTICLSAMILLGMVYDFSEILRILRILRLPSLLITTLSLTYRYLFVLNDEAHRMLRARRCRSFSNRKVLSWHILSAIAGLLFIRSYERAGRIFSAMCARGWRFQ